MTERSVLIDIARQLQSALENLQNEDPDDDEDDVDQIVCRMKDFLADEDTTDLREELDENHPVSSILDLVEKLVTTHSNINAVSTQDDGYDSDDYEEYEEPTATCDDAGGEDDEVHSEASNDNGDLHDDNGGDDLSSFDTYDPSTCPYAACRISCELKLHDQLELWFDYDDSDADFECLKGMIADYVADFIVYSHRSGDFDFGPGASQYAEICCQCPGVEYNQEGECDYDPEREDEFMALFDRLIDVSLNESYNAQ